MKPLVSICCITYNHELYIRDAIEGFLMQKTTFPLEIIIHDDASSDKTAEIIKDYASKYPNLFVLILQTENQWSKGIRPSSTYVWPRSRGKYIALCEGDDYWTDPYKLQKQVDFLEANPDFSMCFHNSVHKYEVDNYKIHHFEVEKKEYFSDELLLKWIVPTASIVFRKDCISSNFQNSNIVNGDIFLILSCAESGRVSGMADYMATYRIQADGLSISRIRKDDVSLQIKYINQFRFFKKYFKKLSRYASTIKIVDNCITVFLHYKKHRKLIAFKYLIMAIYCRPELIYKGFIKILKIK